MPADQRNVVTPRGVTRAYSFQDFLLQLSAATAEGMETHALLQLFCRSAREFFGASTSAFAELDAAEDLVVVEADGRGSRELLRLKFPLIACPAAAQAVRARSSVTSPRLKGPWAAALGESPRGSFLAAPAMARGNVYGMALLFRETGGFTSEQLAQATVFAALLGGVVGNARLFLRLEQAKRQWVEDFDAITDWIVVHDRRNRISRLNRSLAEYLGVSPAKLIGADMRVLARIAAPSDPRLCPFCESTSKQPSQEHLISAHDRTYLVSTSGFRGGVDEDSRTIHVLKDVTDRREAERRYRELFDNIQEGLFFSTPEGRFIEVNDALVRMLGYNSREELLRVDPSRHLVAWPEQRRRFLAAIQKTGVLRNWEESLRRKDGNIIHTLQNIYAVRDGNGKVAQYRGLMLDVTEQRTFQAQLQRERDFNRKILNNTQSMILVLDTAGLVSYANRRCFEAGYREPDLLGHRLEEFVPPGRRTEISRALQETLRGRQTENLELPIQRGDGKTGQFSISLSPIRDEEGHVNSIVVVLTDITDAAVLQAKLMHTEKMAAVGQLVSGVAHEVNNPLAAVVGFTDLLIESPDVPEAAKNDLRVILQEAERTKVIVQNLLRFARQTPVKREPVQVNAILEQTLKLRSYDFSSHGLEIVEQFDAALPEIIGDAHQLQQVFLNILNNAYDAVRETSHRGRIEIATATRDTCVEVLFRDNGPGISDPERIFDPFFTTKEVGKGTGLGLSICYGIVRDHGGEISCWNNAGEPGCTFVVRLPMAAEAARPEAKGA